MNRIDHANRWIASGIFGILLSLISACAPDSGGPAGSKPEPAVLGEQVFNENCAVCHGAEGRGPSLAEIRSLSSDERRNRIRNHPVAGQIPQRLPANQASAVIEFLE